MNSDGTQAKLFLGGWVGGNPARDLATWAEEMRNKSERVPTFEEILAAQYQLTPEQAQNLVAVIRQTAINMQTTFEAVAAAIRNVLFHVQESPDFQAFVHQLNEHKPKQNYYEKPRLPSQQGYNRTPYDRWRNSLGGGRGQRRQ